MSYKIHMAGRDDPRTLYQIDRLYAWKHGKYFSPATVEISPTNACNQKCKYCYAWRESKPREILRDDILIGCFDQLADAGVGGVVIQGTGEPLLHKALPEAIERGAARNIPIQLTTNGVLLNSALQDKILHNIFCLRISVLDNDPERYAEHHGCSKKLWHTLVDNIEKTVSMRARQNLPFSIWATVYLFEDNFKDLYSAVKLCKEIGIDFIYVTEPQYTSFSPSGKNSYASTRLKDTENEMDSICANILSLVDDNFNVKIKFDAKEHILSGNEKQTWKNDYCQGIKFYTLIGCDGEVYPCWRCWEEKRYSYGSLYEKTFSEIWQSTQRNQIEKMVMETPPDGDECFVCTICLLNKILDDTSNATQWMNFL
jgi:radical SAM protein with 4Fe4S-binding SPASM domain